MQPPRGKKSPARFSRLRVCAGCIKDDDTVLGRSTMLEAPECQRCHRATRWGRIVEFLTLKIVPSSGEPPAGDLEG